MHNQVQPNATKLEKASKHQGVQIDGFTEEQAEELRQKGHEIEWTDCEHDVCWSLLISVAYSTACAIKIGYDGGLHWEPAPEPRKEDSGGCVFP